MNAEVTLPGTKYQMTIGQFVGFIVACALGVLLVLGGCPVTDDSGSAVGGIASTGGSTGGGNRLRWGSKNWRRR